MNVLVIGRGGREHAIAVNFQKASMLKKYLLLQVILG